MEADLGLALERFVAEMVDSGLYQSRNEVIRDGLRLLKERQDVKLRGIEFASRDPSRDRGS